MAKLLETKLPVAMGELSPETFNRLVRVLELSLNRVDIDSTLSVNETQRNINKFQAGDLIWNLTRLFNTREGMTIDNDILPNRFYNEKAPEGDPSGQLIDKKAFEKARAEYYECRGWDNQGIPTTEKLKSLGL